MKLIDDFCLTLKSASSLGFDDPGALDNETHKTITELDQGTLSKAPLKKVNFR